MFAEATTENALAVLKEAIAKHGRPASILTDHGSQFYANQAEYKKRGASRFEEELVRLGIKHIMARVNHPQTNGKLERFHGEIQRKQKWFGTIDELVHWYNHTKSHMSLDWDNLETPAKAFVRKMPEKRIQLLMSRQERNIMQNKRRTNFGIPQMLKSWYNKATIQLSLKLAMILAHRGEKVQSVLLPQKQRKNACVVILSLLLTIIIAAGGGGEVVYDGIITGGGYMMMPNSYAQNQEGIINSTSSELKKFVSDKIGADGKFTTNDNFGSSVSLYNNIFAIGAINYDGKYYSNIGAVYIFERNDNGTWPDRATAKIVASDGRQGDNFGRFVSLYNNTLLIGVNNYEDGKGAVYVFERNDGGTWEQKQKILGQFYFQGSDFGSSVSLYNNTALIGASSTSLNGAAYIFDYVYDKQSQTYEWKQHISNAVHEDSGRDSFSPIILFPNDSDVKSNDRFGRSVSLYNNTALIGASRTSSNDGAAYIFERGADGFWPVIDTSSTKGYDSAYPTMHLVREDDVEDSEFGRSVSLYNNTALISAIVDDGLIGAAFVFERNDEGTWVQKQKLVSGSTEKEIFGNSVSLYNNIALISAPGISGVNSTVYIFERNDEGTWEKTRQILLTDATDEDPELVSISLYDNTALIGLPKYDSVDDDSNVIEANYGAAYLYSGRAPVVVAELVSDTDTAKVKEDESIKVEAKISSNLDCYQCSELTYTWTLTNEENTVIFTSITDNSVFIFDTPRPASQREEYTLSLVATNDRGVSSDSVHVDTFTVNRNYPPTASIVGSTSVNEGDNVVLNSTSSDPDGAISAYLWNADPDITLDNTNTQTISFTAPKVSADTTYTIILTVTDDSGVTHTTSHTFTINNVKKIPRSGGGGSSSSSISGSSSIQIDDIYIRSVSWDCNAGTIKIIAGPDSEYLSVSVRTTQLGVHQASIAADNQISGYKTFVSSMAQTEDYIGIQAVAQYGRNVNVVNESINVDACVGEKTYSVPGDDDLSTATTTTTTKQQLASSAVDPEPTTAAPAATTAPPVDPEPTKTTSAPASSSPPVDPEPEPPVCGPGTEVADGFCRIIIPSEGEEPEENGGSSSSGGGGCLIATAAYGTELAPQVQFLREVRENTVLQTQSGSAFMDSFNLFYYSFSPGIADLERQNPIFREAVKIAITPMISSLAILGYADIDSESEMLAYGIGIVALNIGLYVALPVSAMYCVAARFGGVMFAKSGAKDHF